MNDAVIHSAFNFLQQVIATDASAKEKLLQLFNALPAQAPVIDNRSTTRKSIGAADLLKKKHWSNDDRRQAMQLVKLPGSIKNFFTQNNMV